jgi:hypothetical protein
MKLDEGRERLRWPECPAVQSGEVVKAKPDQEPALGESLG